HVARIRRGGGLARGQAVDVVVHDHVGDVDVAPDGMHQVADADAVAVAVTPGGHHQQIPVGQLHGGGHGQGPAVDAVEAVGGHELGDLARAADARHAHILVGLDAQVDGRRLHGPQHGEVA